MCVSKQGHCDIAEVPTIDLDVYCHDGNKQSDSAEIAESSCFCCYLSVALTISAVILFV